MEWPHNFETGPTIESEIEQLAQNVTAEQWMALPELPVAICEDFDGVLHIKERVYRSYDWARGNEPAYRFEPVSKERWDELQAAANQLAGRAVNANQFFNQLVDSSVIINNLAIPIPYDKDVPWETTTVVDLLRVIREGALENLYATKVLGYAKALLAAHAPEALPKEPTAGIVFAQNKKYYYFGKFGGMHLISVSLSERLTPQDISELRMGDIAVLTAVHELAHQAHAEISGLPDTTRFNWETVTSPRAAFYLAQDYYKEVSEIGYDAHAKLADVVVSMVSETLASTVEEEIYCAVGAGSIFVGGNLLRLGSEEETARAAISAILPGTDSPRRRELLKSLFAINLKAIVDLPDDVLQAIIVNPKNILTLKKGSLE